MVYKGRGGSLLLMESPAMGLEDEWVFGSIIFLRKGVVGAAAEGKKRRWH